jgi:HEAT repeat protein
MRRLVELLADGHAGVREAAALACGRGRVREAVPALVRRLDGPPSQPDDLSLDPSRQAEQAREIRARAAAAPRPSGYWY